MSIASQAFRAGFAALMIGAAPLVVAQENYPSKPIRMIVAFAPGGGTDIIGRFAAKAIQDALGASVVVENKPGAGGAIGTELVAKSPPDGYTLITGGTGSHAINPALFPKLPYDPVRDFAPVSLVAATPYLMLVANTVPAQNVKEFIALAKQKPGELAMASSGNGGMPHLAGELFQLLAGVKLSHVPYKGTGQVFPDLIPGRVHVTFSDIVAAYPHVQSGRVRVLAVTSPTRVPSYPDVPTLAEAGVPGYEAVGWFGVFAPAGTPAPIVRKLRDAIASQISQPATRKTLEAQGAEPVANTPEEFAAVLKTDIARWAKVVKESGAKVD